MAEQIVVDGLTLDKQLYEFYTGHRWVCVTEDDAKDRELMKAFEDYARVKWSNGHTLSENGYYGCTYLVCNYANTINAAFMQAIKEDTFPRSVQCASTYSFVLDECGGDASRIVRVRDFVPAFSALKPASDEEFDEIMGV